MKELPEVPEERFDELLCAAMEQQLKFYDRPLAACAPPSPGNASLWALAAAPRVDRQWAYNGFTCARFEPDKISVLLWPDYLLLALQGEVPYPARLATRAVAGPARRGPRPHPPHHQDRPAQPNTFDDYAGALNAAHLIALCVPAAGALLTQVLHELHATLLAAAWCGRPACRPGGTCALVRASRPTARHGGVVGGYINLDFLELPVARSCLDFLQMQIDVLIGRVCGWSRPSDSRRRDGSSQLGRVGAPRRGAADVLVLDRDTRSTSAVRAGLHGAHLRLGTSSQHHQQGRVRQRCDRSRSALLRRRACRRLDDPRAAGGVRDQRLSLDPSGPATRPSTPTAASISADS